MKPYQTPIILLCFASIFIAGSYFIYLNIGRWLSWSDTTTKTEIIVCLSNETGTVDKAISLYNQGYGDKILVTTDFPLASLIKHGMNSRDILELNRSASTTYEEALYVSQFLNQTSYSSITVVSAPYHLRRVRWSFDHLLPSQINHKVYVAYDSPEMEGFWWDKKSNRRYVLRELPKLIYYWISHGIIGTQTDPQWARRVQSWYMKFVHDFA